jgi:hypothetical protein
LSVPSSIAAAAPLPHPQPPAQHGDPRDPKVDAVDWVERIPFAETRNYVERVIENLQVYRKRFGDSTGTIEPNLHRAAMVERRPVATPVELSIPH